VDVSTREEIVRLHDAAFGSSQNVRVFRAPGRVNLIGEHTDYNLGFVLPTALEMACFVATSPNSEGRLRVYSENYSEMREWNVADLPALTPARHWSDYFIGVAQQLLRLSYEIVPINVLIYSTVPVGSGLSSSASLEVSSALGLLGDQSIEPVELAKLARRAENEFVGMPCGIMDQYISVFGQEHAAIMIDCRSLEYEAVEIPEDVAIIAINSMVKHELGQSAYRHRVEECAAAVEVLQRQFPEVASLRDATTEMLAAVSDSMPPVPMRRARHVVTEDDRVLAFAAASRAGDRQQMGQLFVGSHASMRADYEISCEEIDFLVDTALTLPGVFGARMTGGGFGGCTVNLLEPAQAEAFVAKLSELYRSKYGIQPEVYPVRPSQGAAELR
jgi:galactokinase